VKPTRRYYILCDRDGKPHRAAAIHAYRKCPHIAYKPDFTSEPRYGQFVFVKQITSRRRERMLAAGDSVRWWRCQSCRMGRGR